MNVQNKNKMNGICLPSQVKTRLSSVFVTIWQVWGRIFFVGEVSSGQVLELTQSASRDIYEFIESRLAAVQFPNLPIPV